MKLNVVNNQPSFGMAWKLNQKSLVGADRKELDLLKDYVEKNRTALAEATKDHFTTIYANVKNGEIETLSLRTLPRQSTDLITYARDKYKVIKDSIKLVKFKQQPEYEVYNIPFKKAVQGHYNLFEDIAQTVEATDSRFANKDRISRYLGEDTLRGES